MKHIRREEGMTIIEVLLTVSLMLVAVAVAADGLFNLSRSSAGAQVRVFSQTQNRVGMERLTNLLRQATYAPGVAVDSRNTNPVISSASDSQIVFTSRGTGSNTVQQFTVAATGGNLSIGTGNCSGNPCTWSSPTLSMLIANVKNDPAGPCAYKAPGSNPQMKVFRYFTNNSGAGTLDEIPDIASADLASVDTVEVSLWTQETGNGQSKTCEPLYARVNLRNMTVQ